MSKNEETQLKLDLTNAEAEVRVWQARTGELRTSLTAAIEEIRHLRADLTATHDTARKAGDASREFEIAAVKAEARAAALQGALDAQQRQAAELTNQVAALVRATGWEGR